MAQEISEIKKFQLKINGLKLKNRLNLYKKFD